MQHRLDDQARQLREPREAITTSAPDGPSEMESSEGDENSVAKHPSTSETPASPPPLMLYRRLCRRRHTQEVWRWRRRHGAHLDRCKRARRPGGRQ